VSSFDHSIPERAAIGPLGKRTTPSPPTLALSLSNPLTTSLRPRSRAHAAVVSATAASAKALAPARQPCSGFRAAWFPATLATSSLFSIVLLFNRNHHLPGIARRLLDLAQPNAFIVLGKPSGDVALKPMILNAVTHPRAHWCGNSSTGSCASASRCPVLFHQRQALLLNRRLRSALFRRSTNSASFCLANASQSMTWSSKRS
jgi:hypothetical protein